MKENETGISSLHFFIPIVVVIHVCSLGVDTEGLGGGGAQSFVVLMVTPTWMTSDYRTCVCRYIKVLIKS